MPGDNCSVVGCGTCRKTKAIGIWKLPAPRNDAYRKWRQDWLNVLKKYRVTDNSFQRQIDNDKVFTCQKHFTECDIEISKLCLITCFSRVTCCMLYAYVLSKQARSTVYTILSF